MEDIVIKNKNIIRFARIYDNVRWKVFAVAGIFDLIPTIK